MNDEMCEVLNPDLWTEMHYAKEISGLQQRQWLL